LEIDDDESGLGGGEFQGRGHEMLKGYARDRLRV
jgi:hypothetical protein